MDRYAIIILRLHPPTCPSNTLASTPSKVILFLTACVGTPILIILKYFPYTGSFVIAFVSGCSGAARSSVSSAGASSSPRRRGDVGILHPGVREHHAPGGAEPANAPVSKFHPRASLCASSCARRCVRWCAAAQRRRGIGSSRHLVLGRARRHTTTPPTTMMMTTTMTTTTTTMTTVKVRARDAPTRTRDAARELRAATREVSRDSVDIVRARTRGNTRGGAGATRGDGAMGADMVMLVRSRACSRD